MKSFNLVFSMSLDQHQVWWPNSPKMSASDDNTLVYYKLGLFDVDLAIMPLPNK